MTNTSGTVVFTEQYDPHGQKLMQTSNNGPYYLSKKFTGYERDYGTNTDNAKARQYHHNNGRFMQPDPLSLLSSDLTNPQSLNLYSYVQNDPVNKIDPNGLNLIDPDYWEKNENSFAGGGRGIFSPGIHSYSITTRTGVGDGFGPISWGPWETHTYYSFVGGGAKGGGGGAGGATGGGNGPSSKERSKGTRAQAELATRVEIYNNCMRTRASEKKAEIDKLFNKSVDAVVENATEDLVVGAIGGAMLGLIAGGYGGGFMGLVGAVPGALGGSIAGSVLGAVSGFLYGTVQETLRQLAYKYRNEENAINRKYSYQANREYCRGIAGI